MSRAVLLSFWSLTRAVDWLRCRCEELGVRMTFVSPYKTSQRCHRCGKIDSGNRKGERFRCVSCRREDDADPERGAESGILGIGGSLYLFSATPFEGFDHRSLNLVTDPTSEVRSGFEADLAKMPVHKACGDDRIRLRKSTHPPPMGAKFGLRRAQVINNLPKLNHP